MSRSSKLPILLESGQHQTRQYRGATPPRYTLLAKLHRLRPVLPPRAVLKRAATGNSKKPSPSYRVRARCCFELCSSPAANSPLLCKLVSVPHRPCAPGWRASPSLVTATTPAAARNCSQELELGGATRHQSANSHCKHRVAPARRLLCGSAEHEGKTLIASPGIQSHALIFIFGSPCPPASSA